MSSFVVYKVVHLVSVFVFLTATTATFFLGSQLKEVLVGFKIVCGLSGFVILFTGLALIHTLAIGFPLWALAKGFIWLVLTPFGAIAAKRFSPKRSVTAYLVMMLLASGAVYFAVVKPW